MASGVAPVLVSVVCVVRDDDERTFDFVAQREGSRDVAERVAAALAMGRHVRCSTMAPDPASVAREERFLIAKGYRRAHVQL